MRQVFLFGNFTSCKLLHVPHPPDIFTKYCINVRNQAYYFNQLTWRSRHVRRKHYTSARLQRSVALLLFSFALRLALTFPSRYIYAHVYIKHHDVHRLQLHVGFAVFCHCLNSSIYIRGCTDCAPHNFGRRKLTTTIVDADPQQYLTYITTYHSHMYEMLTKL